MALIRRGDVYDVLLPVGQHPAVVVTAQEVLERSTEVMVALVTTTIRGYATEVELGPADGLVDSVARTDNVSTVRETDLGRRRGELRYDDEQRLDRALRTAFGL